MAPTASTRTSTASRSRMPIRTPAPVQLFAAFTIDGDKSRGTSCRATSFMRWRPRGRGILVLGAIINYQDTRGIGSLCGVLRSGWLATRAGASRGALRSLLFRSHHGTGIYIYDLPVSSEISVKGGLGIIRGMPKRHANLDFVGSKRQAGQQPVRPRRAAVLPDRGRPPAADAGSRCARAAVNYCAFRGMLMQVLRSTSRAARA